MLNNYMGVQRRLIPSMVKFFLPNANNNLTKEKEIINKLKTKFPNITESDLSLHLLGPF